MIAEPKKLLILSGFSYMIEIVEAANKSGFYTIIADNIVNSSAKKYADHSYSVSPSDIEQLADIAKQENIAGIFHAFDDMNVWHSIALCKKLNLPFYSASKALDVEPNLSRFKDYCRVFNVPVIEVGAIDKQPEFQTIGFSPKLKPVAS